jgi:hypothetical protein
MPDSDTLVAVALGIIMAATSYWGFHVTVSAPQSTKQIRLYRIGFATLGIIGCVLIYVQASRASKIQADLQVLMARIERNTKEPAHVEVQNTVPPAQVVIAPSPSTEKAQVTESPNSLRRRIKRLADEMEVFWQERQEHHPPYTNGDPKATGEQARINEASNKYDRETGPQCLSGFEDRTREIIEELKTKGVDVTSGFWEGMIEQHRCIGAFELKDFRALAYRVDAADKLVVF